MLLIEISLYVCHQSVLCAGDIQANSPNDRPMAAISPATTAPAHRAEESAPTSLSRSTNSPGILQLAANSSAKPVSAQAVPATSADGLGAAASGPATSGPVSLLQPEQYNFAPQALEDQDKEDSSDEEDSEDGMLSDDDDISSWGSDDEIWGTDSDYYDTDEEEEALAGQYFIESAVRSAHAVQAASCML